MRQKPKSSNSSFMENRKRPDHTTTKSTRLFWAATNITNKWAGILSGDGTRTILMSWVTTPSESWWAKGGYDKFTLFYFKIIWDYGLRVLAVCLVVPWLCHSLERSPRNGESHRHFQSQLSFRQVTRQYKGHACCGQRAYRNAIDSLCARALFDCGCNRELIRVSCCFWKKANYRPDCAYRLILSRFLRWYSRT